MKWDLPGAVVKEQSDKNITPSLNWSKDPLSLWQGWSIWVKKCMVLGNYSREYCLRSSVFLHLWISNVKFRHLPPLLHLLLWLLSTQPCLLFLLPTRVPFQAGLPLVSCWFPSKVLFIFISSPKIYTESNAFGSHHPSVPSNSAVAEGRTCWADSQQCCN